MEEIDLTYEGIATGTPAVSRIPTLFLEEIDLTYEGIATSLLVVRCTSVLYEEIDLTYEGIATIISCSAVLLVAFR